MHVLGTAGHVDHGKSTLVQRLTGTHPDRLIEERTREMTIDLGFAWMGIEPDREVAIIDVPGHARFIDNMLAGSGGINACLLVVAADDGWMPQTQEHLDILQFLGVRHGVVALTKTDLVDSETVEIATEEIQEYLAGTTLDGAPVVPVSAVSDAGISALVDAIQDALTRTPPAADLGRPKLWVDRVFSVSGSGTVITGTLTGGSVSVGDTVTVLPRQEQARIRGVQSHGQSAECIGPGHRVALNLAGLRHWEVSRGNVVVVGHQWENTSSIGVVLDSPTHLDAAITERGAYHLHIGTAQVNARVRIDGSSLEPGDQAIARIDLDSPLALTFGDRFVLRDVGRRRIAAGGRVLAARLDRVPGRRWGQVVESLERRRTLDRWGLAKLLVAERVVSDGEMISELGLDDARLDALLTGLESDGDLLRRDGLAISAHQWQSAKEGIPRALTEFLEHNLREPGMSRAALARSSGVSQSLFDMALSELIRKSTVTAAGPLLTLPDHRIELSEEEEEQLSRLRDLLESSGTRPPTVSELATGGWSEEFITTLVRLGHLEQIDPTIVMSPVTVDEIVARLSVLTSHHGPFTIADARDTLDSSRKFVMPVLYYLDQRGITRRDDDYRVVRGAAQHVDREISA